FTVDLLARAVSGPGAGRGEGKWVFLADPDDAKRVLTADPAVVLAGETNVFLRDLVGARSILVLDEPEHMAERKLMLPAFHGERVKSYGALICDVTRAEIGRWPIGESFALWPRMQAITLEVIIRTVFGISEPRRLEQMRELLRAMLNRMTSRWWLASQTVLVTLVGSRPAENNRFVRALLG